MKKILKIIVPFLFLIIYSYNLPNVAYATDHTAEKQVIKELKKEIYDLGAEPVKKKNLFQRDKKWIIDLKKQLAELKEEKEKKEKIEAVKKEIQEEIESLGGEVPTDTDDIDGNEEIIVLKKQLEDLKKKKAEEKKKKAKKEKQKLIKMAKEELIDEIKSFGETPVVAVDDIDKDEDIIALRDQLKEIRDQKEKDEAKKAAEEENELNRAEAIQDVRKEILYFGGTPIAEYEYTTEDKYISALREQLEEIKKERELEEEKIKADIPEWYINMPDSSGSIMYSRGSYTAMDLDFAENLAVEQAVIKLALNLQRKTDSKIEIMMREAGIDQDNTLKREMKQISRSVAKTVSINGYKILQTKMSQLANGKYITFVVIEFPLSLNWQAYLNNLEKNEVVKEKLTKIKNTDSFKELEQSVAEFTGA